MDREFRSFMQQNFPDPKGAIIERPERLYLACDEAARLLEKFGGDPAEISALRRKGGRILCFRGEAARILHRLQKRARHQPKVSGHPRGELHDASD